MPNSNTRSNKIQLPNGCFVPEFKLLPKNPTNTEKDWIICYDFYDPEYNKPSRRQIRGMNHIKNFTERKRKVKAIIDVEIEYLQSGFNPFKREVVAVNFEVTKNTGFIAALKVAYTKVKGVEGTLQDIRSVIKGVELSAKQLNIHTLPIATVTRKYFVLIFEQCFKNNPRFSFARQNKYRAYLMKLYKVLIKLEAVEVNPLRDIEKENEIKNERVLPTEDQRCQINEYLKANYYSFWRAIQIFFASGSREIELMRVQKKHVDLKNQTCLYLIKKRKGETWVRRPIADKVFYLWQEILKDCRQDDYLFSKGMVPGPTQIRSEQFGRRWNRHIKKKLGIDVDLYSLKHLNTTELSDQLDKLYNPAKDIQELTAHKSEKMIAKVYDLNFESRKYDKVKKLGRLF